MEIIPEGKNFRLVQDNELPELLLVLEQYMPEAVKVRNLLLCSIFCFSKTKKNIKVKTVKSLTMLEKAYTYISIYFKHKKAPHNMQRMIYRIS